MAPSQRGRSRRSPAAGRGAPAEGTPAAAQKTPTSPTPTPMVTAPSTPNPSTPQPLVEETGATGAPAEGTPAAAQKTPTSPTPTPMVTAPSTPNPSAPQPLVGETSATVGVSAQLDDLKALVLSLSARLDQAEGNSTPVERPAAAARDSARTPRATRTSNQAPEPGYWMYPEPEDPALVNIFQTAGSVLSVIGTGNDKEVGDKVRTHGWRRYIPTGGPLAVLNAYWYAKKGKSLSGRTQEAMWPVLVEQLPEAKDLGRSGRPQAICTSLEGYAKVFMEVAASAGPAVDPPAGPTSWTPLEEWHTEATLVLRAQRGLMGHPTLHEILEGHVATSVEDLFQYCEEALEIDENEKWTKASQQLQELYLKGCTVKDLLEYRRSFSKLAQILSPAMGESDLRNNFIQGCLRGNAPTSWHQLFYDDFADEKTWNGLYTRLYKTASQAEKMVDVYKFRPRNPATRTTPVVPPRLNHMDHTQGTYHQLEFLEKEDAYDEDNEMDELMCNHLALTGKSYLDVLREACFICSQTGHSAADCPTKDAPEQQLSTEMAKTLNWAARQYTRHQDRQRATGQRPSGKTWGSKPL